MSTDTSVPSRKRHAGIWVYNIRILLGNTYWLVVTPVAAIQLVLFWNMATATLFSTARAAQTVELLAPILAAFLCAHALAPEQDGVGELVFVRPVSVEKVLALRLAVIFAFVFAALTPAFVIYAIGIDGFPLAVTLLAALPSMLMLSVLAMALASASRNPMLGFAGAGAFWALDLVIGGYFNPLVSLHRFADCVAGQPMSEQWVASKFVLLALAALIYTWQRRMLGRPAAPRRWVSAVRAGVAVGLLILVYVSSGAAYKVAYGLAHERELGARSRLWYQQQFRGYGPIPVPWIFGPAFALYVQAELGRNLPLADTGGGGLWTPIDLERMQQVVSRYPRSIWADNAQYEIARFAAHQQARAAWLVLAYEPGKSEPVRTKITEDISRAAHEYEVLADRYPNSPFAPLALAECAAIALRILDFEAARVAYERLVRDHPSSPQSYVAGLRLSALNLREGASNDALRAADVAAGVAPWDLKAEALLAAARAAGQAGDREVARDRYRRAREVAREAIERATRGEKTPSNLLKGDLFERSNAIVAVAERALSGRGEVRPMPSIRSAVMGRVLLNGAGASSIRVALGASPAANRLPSPFLPGPAASAVTDRAGRFRIDALPPGSYRAAAFAFPIPQDASGVVMDGLSLPVDVEGAAIVLPDLHVRQVSVPDAPEMRRPPPTTPPSERLSSRRGRGGGRRRR